MRIWEYYELYDLIPIILNGELTKQLHEDYTSELRRDYLREYRNLPRYRRGDYLFEMRTLASKTALEILLSNGPNR